MMGNFLTYIWDKFSSLFGLFGFGRDETDDGILTIVKTEGLDEVDLYHQGTRSHKREVSGQSREKILAQVPFTYFNELLHITKHCGQDRSQAQLKKLTSFQKND